MSASLSPKENTSSSSPLAYYSSSSIIGFASRGTWASRRIVINTLSFYEASYSRTQSVRCLVKCLCVKPYVIVLNGQLVLNIE